MIHPIRGGTTAVEDGEETAAGIGDSDRAMGDTKTGMKANNSPYSMKWHNCLMVLMIFGGLTTIAGGLYVLLGSAYLKYGVNAAEIYGRHPGLKSCDMFCGVLLIGLGVFEFIVRSRLKQYRSNGPGSLRVMHIGSMLVVIVYLIWATSATGVNLYSSTGWGLVLGRYVLFLIVNSIYYSNRRKLFVH